MALIIVDCEAPFGVGSPAVGDMTEFGAVRFVPEPPFWDETFHGEMRGVPCWHDGGTSRSFDPAAAERTIKAFEQWLYSVCGKGGFVFVSDNPAYDWQWINFYFWKYGIKNPFGHSGRRIGDFYAGLTGDFRNTQRWKRLRVTNHDHNPVHDAMGNAEALGRMLKGERV